MIHKTLEAKATTITDQGEFTAIAAAYTLDRGGDRIIPGAFAKTIAKWQTSGKRIPLHWDHEGDPQYIIGSVDPAQVKETDVGLFVAGKVDLKNSDLAKEAWRAMKTDSMSLSFGYMVIDGQKAKDAFELREVDVFEISVVPGPMNADTRFLSLKSVKDMSEPELREEFFQLRKRLDEIETHIEGQPPAAKESKDESEQAPPATQQASDPEAIRIELERLQSLT